MTRKSSVTIQMQQPISSISSRLVGANFGALQTVPISTLHSIRIHRASHLNTSPFLLAKVKDLTGGDSLTSNIQLVLNNARLAAKTAAALTQ